MHGTAETGQEAAGRLKSRAALVPPLVGLVAFAAMALVWLSGREDLFRMIVQLWGVDAHAYPFYDLQGLLSAVECTRAGIDAYLANPCDPSGRVYDYPPSWSLLTLLPVNSGWLNPLGLAVDLAFIASLALLPAARTAGAVRLVVAGVLSTATVFAVERANNDLVVFVLVAVGAALLSRPRAGVGGYVAIQVAGLLKYFPLAAMALALREVPRRFFGIAAASIGATALFAAFTWPDLVHALQNIPVGSAYRVVFGASNVGGGLVLLGAADWLGHLTTAALTLAGVAGGVALGLREDTARAVAPLDGRERTFLLAGGLVILACFFATQNIDYRIVHTLIMLPSLTALAIANAGPGGVRRYTVLAGLALALLWFDLLRTWVLTVAYSIGGVGQFLLEAGPGFILREVLWWWFCVLLLSVVTALLKDGPLPAALLARFRSRPLPAAGS